MLKCNGSDHFLCQKSESRSQCRRRRPRHMSRHPTIILVTSFKTLPHEWDANLCEVPCTEPCCMLASCACFPCANFAIRKRALGGDLGNYRCMQGFYCGALACCCPCQSQCGPCCLMGESLVCPHLSVMATRHTVQERLSVRNSCCENCAIDSIICCECALCCVSDDSCFHDALHCAVHCLTCAVMPCMQAQAYHQLKIEGDGYLLVRGGPPPAVDVER